VSRVKMDGRRVRASKHVNAIFLARAIFPGSAC